MQCGSSWNQLSYDLYSLSARSNLAVPILSGDHELWFGGKTPYQLRLEADELLLEIRAQSIDVRLHNRAHVLKFKTTATVSERVDPVALKPQDFVDEWLTRHWPEMESRSAQSDDKLKQWHELLIDPFGEFQLVQQCQEHPDQWLIEIDFDRVQKKELPEPLPAYFLIQQSDPYRFKMLNISFNRQEGCRGNSQPNTENPTLFPKP